MINPYAILGIGVLLVASHAAVGYWQHQDGVTVTTAKYDKRDNIALTEANTKLHDVEDKYRRAEQQHAVAMSDIATNFEKEKQDAKLKTDARIAAVRAGVLRLYSHQTAGVPTIRSGVPNIATGTGGRDGTGDGRLSAGDSGFLLALGGRCNAVRDKLTACQSIVKSDRAQ
jgi:hypothetical protein